MSINVTVNGKPISLTKTRGKMVACEQDSEFNQRRKIRLQQVRQQSKEIAAEVRNRVKQERTKQLSNIEYETEKDLKKFQEKKLHTLQKHYDDCNREIGAAHKNAAMEKDPVEVLNEISKKNDKNAHARLKLAVENKAKEEQQRQNKLELLQKQRKYSKEIEKTRANLVVAINKQHTPSKINRSSKKKRKKKNEQNLSDTFNSDIENISSSPTLRRRSRSPIKPPQMKQKKIFDHEIHTICDDETCQPNQNEKQSKFDIKFTQTEESEKHSKTDIIECNIECPEKENATCCIKSTQTEKPETVKSPRKEKHKVDFEYPQKDDKCTVCWEKNKSRQSLGVSGKSETSYPKRVISSAKDHLMNEDADRCPCCSPPPHDRAILYPVSPPTPTKCTSQFSSCTSVTKELSKDEIKKLIEEHRPMDCRSSDFYKSTKISDRIRQRSDQLSQQDIDLDMRTMNSKKLQMKNIPIVDIPSVKEKTAQLPYVPQTSLKSKVTLTNVPQQQTTKAKYYDHAKHFSKTYVPPASVQKLDKECVEVNASIESAENAIHLKNIQTQEQRAKIRGDKALKRAQIRNDYKQLMEELPVLQRQERLAAMRSHNPEFHMTDERLHELERRRQNRIENIFEKYYHKSKALETPVITIRPVQKPPPEEQMKMPFTALDISEELQAFNIGQWKSENPSQTTRQLSTRKTESTRSSQFVDARETQKAMTDDECRQKCLAELLQRLNKQRELLLQEVQNLPPSSNLQKILHDDTLLHITTGTDDSTTNHSMATKPKFVSVSTSPISSELKKTKGNKKRATTTATASSDSPEEKQHQKKRQKPKEKKAKVAKNDEGTQTSPSILKREKPVRDKPKAVPKRDIPQAIETRAADGDDKLCEIIIKMCDDSKVKICTQPIVGPPEGGGAKHEEKTVRPPQKQQAIANNCDVSSSTSYLSPPILCPKPIAHHNEKPRSDYKDSLYGKPKQTNIDAFPNNKASKEEKVDHVKKHSICKQKNVKSHTPTKIINPQLLNYIKKLLSMSRRSIDDLTVSSVSDVPSPSPNVVESQHNNPFIQLQNVMNYYNLSFADIQDQLSKSSTSASKSDRNASNTNAEMEQLEGDSSPTSDDVDYSEILSKYQEVTRTCVEKISTLTLMIDKIRAEKENLLSPISMDLNENTLTSYLELPPQKGEDSPIPEVNSLSSKNCTSASGGSNKSCSLTQEEIDRYFLEIGPSRKERDQVDKNQGDADAFVPMLKGIPKYNTDPVVNRVTSNYNPIAKHRPPASLAQNMQRYNLNIDMTPHELSTIVELDTATTSKNISEQRAKSPEERVPMRDSDDSQTQQSKGSTSNSGFITISPEQEASSKTSQRKQSPRSRNTKSNLQKVESPSENTSSSSPENFENILRTMGLGWAVSTLKKTQEALALSSSSSSDSSLPKKHVSANNSSSVSEITLKDVLNREFLKKLSSSSSSDSPNFQELQDISDIVGATLNKDRSTTQRTSTPVHHSKSTDSKTNLFASVSDISSVRQHSDENMFLSIPDISLDTNRSLK